MSNFGKNIRQLRINHKWYQKEAAAIIGIKRCSLGAYEEGRAEPPYDVLVKICKAYKIKNPIHIIVGEVDPIN